MISLMDFAPAPHPRIEACHPRERKDPDQETLSLLTVYSGLHPAMSACSGAENMP
jgi:hypothetical protein